jgi:hypothetical protein
MQVTVSTFHLNADRNPYPATTGLQTLSGSILSLNASVVSVHSWGFEPLQFLNFYGIGPSFFTLMLIRMPIHLLKIPVLDPCGDADPQPA